VSVKGNLNKSFIGCGEGRREGGRGGLVGGGGGGAGG